MTARRPVVLAAALALGLLLRPGVGGPDGGTGGSTGPGGLPGLAVAPASASCATTPSIDDAVLLGDVVFVGTVLRTENSGRWATVRVEERWRGARDLGDTVQVRGGPEAGTATPIDRIFATSRYLFVVSQGPGYLTDNQCTATVPWTDDLARLRPIDVSAAPDVTTGAQVTELDMDRLLPTVALVAALVIAVIAYLVILRARRRPPDWFR